MSFHLSFRSAFVRPALLLTQLVPLLVSAPTPSLATWLIVTALSPTTDQVRHYTALADVSIFHCRVHGIRKEFLANTPIAKTDSQTPRSRTLGSQVLLSFAWSHRCCCHVHRARTRSVMQRTKELMIRGRSCHNLFATLLSPSLDSLMLLLQRWTQGRYWLDYIGLVGLLTLVSQTLLSRTRWSLRRYCPKHRSTEAAVRLIGLTVTAHKHRIRQRTVTHIGPLTLLSGTRNSQILGYEHKFCTRSSHAHKTRKCLFHVHWNTKRRSHNHSTLRRSWSCTFTNTAVTNLGLAYTPVYEHRPRKRSSYERRTRKCPVTHLGHKNGPVTYAGLPEAAVTMLDSLTLLVGLH